MVEQSNKQKSIWVGILILLAYSMLTYTFTKNIILGVTMDIISGLSVIGISLLMFPIFNSKKNKLLSLTYLLCKIVEGILMIIGGLLIIFPNSNCTRGMIYDNFHIYFFSFGALFFYILLYKTLVIPKFISLWGVIASLLLLIVTFLKIIEITSPALDALVVPMMLNEVFLAFWLIFKGFNKENSLT